MKSEIDRVKSDLETIQKAIGLAPTFGSEWIRWLKRDTWFYLLWCLPGFILIASTWFRLDQVRRFLGLEPVQWVGILVAALMLGIVAVLSKRMSGGDGRPAGLVREYKRLNGLSWAYIVPLVLYFVWAKEYHVGGRPFMAGLWLLSGSATFVGAVCTRVWVLLGWAIPLMAMSLLQPAADSLGDGFWLGLMFVAVALLSAGIQTWQLRGLGQPHASH